MIPIPQFTPKRGLSSFVRSLFANSEQGAWYDPSDMSTLFQTASGSAAVTAVEQPVSLMLDKSKGLALGSEVVTNGTFAADSNWTKGTGWSIGSGVATKTAGSAAALSQSVTVTAGAWYKITFTVTRTAGSVTPQFTGTTTVAGAAISAAGTYTQYLLAATGNNSFEFSGDASFAGTVDDVSVKSIAGNHAYTPSSATASRPVLSAMVNLLEKTEQFDNAYWTKSRGTVSANTNATTDPLGGNTADSFVESAGQTYSPSIDRTVTSVTGITYTISIYAKPNGTNYLRIAEIISSSSVRNTWFNLSNGTVGTKNAAHTASITSAGNGWYRCSVTVTVTTGRSERIIFLPEANDNTDTTVGAGNGLYLWGADLRVANDGVGIPSYQRVNTSTDYDTVGFPMYLKFDGSDDYMQTNAIAWDSTVMSAWAGIRILGPLDTSPRYFDRDSKRMWLSTQATGANYNRFIVGHSTTVLNGDTSVNSVVLPQTFVGSVNWNGGNKQTNVTQKLNGSVSSGTTGNDSSGTLVSDNNTAIYIGNRAALDRALNGRIYSMIIRGASSSDAQIAGAESYVNSRTKAY